MMIGETPFEFTAAWHALGILTPARLAELEQLWAQGEDRNPEHYRWHAFRSFLQERRPLSPELAVALYELGATEADVAMGASIMHQIAALPECPDVVLERARASGRKHLIKAASRPTASDAP